MLDQAYDLLKEYNLKITPQRKAILQVLYDCKGHHLEIENIYKLLVGGKNKRIGLATIYRTMETFEKIGLVSRLSIEDSPARYEWIGYDKSGHHHLICLECGQIQEMNDINIEKFKNHILKDKGFEVANKSMKIYGYCDKCRKK